MLQNRVEYGIVVFTAVVLFLFYRNFFFFYLFTFIILLPVISYLMTKRALGKMNVSASFGALSFQQGSDIPVLFEVTNNSYAPFPSVVIEFKAENGFYPCEEIQVMNLPLRRGKRTYTWHIQSKYSGRITVSGEKVTVRDYLGLFLFDIDCPFSAYACALPARNEVVMDAVENVFREGDETESDSLDYTEDVTQIKDFRQYIPGDRMQKVNWKISVKRDELYVKEYELESSRTLCLIAELRRDGTGAGFLDEIIGAFYSAGLKLIELEIPFVACWYDCSSDTLIREFTDNTDSFDNSLMQMFMASSYEEYRAYEKYFEGDKEKGDRALYFTSPSFARIKEYELAGMYKDSVAIVCL